MYKTGIADTALRFGLILIFSLTGCNTQDGATDETSEETAAISEELANSAEYDLWQTVTGDFKDGMFRGVSFNDSREKVQITETFEVFEELPTQIGYTHDTRELETVDVYYHFTDDQIVQKIVVDIFLNGKTPADRLLQIADWYFTGSYGAVAESTDVRKVWRSADAVVVVENVSSGIDNGLKITFTPSELSVLALRKG